MTGSRTDREWRPGAGLEVLEARAALFAAIRRFFAERDVLEVVTPALAATTATDPQLASFELPGRGFLQTSPEFAMKRLLARDRRAIYQLSHAFRAAEQGRRHNPEFAMLEWYRPDFALSALIAEVADLVGPLLGIAGWRCHRYADLFEHAFSIDPHTADPAELAALARSRFDCAGLDTDRDGWLQLLFSQVIEPGLGHDAMDFVLDFPASQAALAECVPDAAGRTVACRFELFVAGMELANGYQELRDAEEQRRRQQADRAQRARLGLPVPPLDERLLAALEHGLPPCAGVALGVDRLLMRQLGLDDIDAALPFAFDRA
jgi:lysyl-tRNA synthetase class 2